MQRDENASCRGTGNGKEIKERIGDYGLEEKGQQNTDTQRVPNVSNAGIDPRWPMTLTMVCLRDPIQDDTMGEEYEIFIGLQEAP